MTLQEIAERIQLALLNSNLQTGEVICEDQESATLEVTVDDRTFTILIQPE